MTEENIKYISYNGDYIHEKFKFNQDNFNQYFNVLNQIKIDLGILRED